MNRFSKVMLAAIVTCCAPIGVAQPLTIETQSTTDTASERSQAGTLEWEIVECANGRVVGHGKKFLTTSEIILDARPLRGGQYFRKRIELVDGFWIEMPIFMGKDKLTGFPLLADRAGEQIYSLEWFDVDGPRHAKQRDDTGALEFDVVAHHTVQDVTRTKFTADVSIRMAPANDEKALRENKPKWRVNIKKGSDIRWPQLKLIPVTQGDPHQQKQPQQQRKPETKEEEKPSGNIG